MDPAAAMQRRGARDRADSWNGRNEARAVFRRDCRGSCRPLLVLLALSIYPLIYSVKVSLTDADGAFTFANFARLFGDRLFAAAALADHRVDGWSRLTVEFAARPRAGRC